MNKGLYGLPKGRGMQTGLFSFPKSEFGNVVASPHPPLDDYTAWWDAAHPDSLTLSGTDVTDWLDRSANDNDISGTSRPVYTTRYINQVPGVDFDGSTDRLHRLITVRRPYSLMLVAQTDTLANCTFLGGGGSNEILAITDATGVLRNLSAGGATTSSKAVGIDVPFVAGIACDLATNMRFWVNGSYQIIATAAEQNGTEIAMGSRSSGASAMFNGIMGEMFLFLRELSIGEMQLMEKYLRAKWHLS